MSDSNKPRLLEFFTYEVVERTMLRDDYYQLDLEAKLQATDEIDKYRGAQGSWYKRPSDHTGYMTIPVLDFLIGAPCNNLVLAFIHGLHPTQIRVTSGEVTTDSMHGRVTVRVDKDNKIEGIEQEIVCAYSCGAAIRQAMLKQKGQ